MKWKPVYSNDVIDLRGKAKYGPHVGNKDKGEYYNPKVRKLTRKLAKVELKAIRSYRGDGPSAKLLKKQDRLSTKLGKILYKNDYLDDPGAFSFGFPNPREKKVKKQLKRAAKRGYY